MSLYSKQDTYKVTRRLYYLIRNHYKWISFKKLRGASGLYDVEGENISISIDHRREIIPSLIHEALHHWHPDWSETKVLRHESQIMNALTPRQVKNILKLWAQYL